MERNSKKKVLNNKGFSLVELIVVIAIMAVLAGVAAPQVIKYIDQSKEAADASNIAMLENAVQMALTNDDAYNDVMSGLGTDDSYTVKITNGSTTAIYTKGSTSVTDNFKSELEQIVQNWPEVKDREKKAFLITIKSTTSGEPDITVSTTSAAATP